MLLTFGHGTASAEELAALIAGAEIELVVDVRTIPKSRRHAHVWAEEMARWVPALSGARYEWRRELGGFRKPQPASANAALRHPAFRAYADYMETPVFEAALSARLAEAAQVRTAIMCSETLWWRCHRRLIADAAALLHKVDVRHLFISGKTEPHVPTRGVRVLEGARLRYDVQNV